MGRRKQEPTKDETVETTAGKPFQMPLMKEDRILHYVNDFQGHKAKMETLNGKYRASRKSCKLEGIDPEVIDEAIQMKRGDPHEFREKFEKRAQLLKIMGMPFQYTIFETRFGDSVEQAKYEGGFAGAGGHNMDCRYPEGSDEANAYIAEYQLEQAKRVPGADTVSEQELQDAVDNPELANRDPVEQPAQ